MLHKAALREQPVHVGQDALDLQGEIRDNGSVGGGGTNSTGALCFSPV